MIPMAVSQPFMRRDAKVFLKGLSDSAWVLRKVADPELVPPDASRVIADALNVLSDYGLDLGRAALRDAVGWLLADDEEVDLVTRVFEAWEAVDEEVGP